MRKGYSESGMTRVGVCALGCGLAVTLLILAAWARGYFVTCGMKAEMVTLGNEMVRDMAAAREKSEVTPEEEVVVSELGQSLAQERLPLVAMLYVKALFERFKTSNGEQRQAIIQCMGEFNTYFKENPNANSEQFIEFMDRIPYMDKAMCGDAVGEGEGESEVIAVPAVADSPTPAPDGA